VRRVLETHTPDQLRIVGEATTGPETIAGIFTLTPDIVILESQMPGFGGIDVGRGVGPERMPVAVFVTACEHHALDAFDVNAVDYVLKPFTDERLISALHKAAAMVRGVRVDNPAAHSIPRDSGCYRSLFAVRQENVYTLVRADEVEWVEAWENYIRLHLRVPAGRKGATAALLVREPITRTSASLDPEHFLRVHRSVIVNRRAVVRMAYLSKHVYEIHLASGAQVMSSRGYAARVRSLLT
jgi:two-component system LytT family response regulator